jgi:hypothetical protein
MNVLKLILLNVLADHCLGHGTDFSTHSNACRQDFVNSELRLDTMFLYLKKK